MIILGVVDYHQIELYVDEFNRISLFQLWAKGTKQCLGKKILRSPNKKIDYAQKA